LRKPHCAVTETDGKQLWETAEARQDDPPVDWQRVRWAINIII
jgi:hypothetical protein